MKPLFITAAVLMLLTGCVSPNPYTGGPAPVVDRSISDAPAPAVQNRATAAGGAPAQGGAVEVVPLTGAENLSGVGGLDGNNNDNGGLVIEDLPAPTPAGPPTIQRRPKPESPPPPEPPRENQAVFALLNSAAAHVDSGAYDSAASDLERAVRIEPNNAAIWYDLGQIRLAQGRYSDAEAMAKKSNSLAADNYLRACNWQLISNALNVQGDSAGADVALAQVSQLGGCSR